MRRALGVFQSGQMGRAVNPLLPASEVRILPPPSQSNDARRTGRGHAAGARAFAGRRGSPRGLRAEAAAAGIAVAAHSKYCILYKT